MFCIEILTLSNYRHSVPYSGLRKHLHPAELSMDQLNICAVASFTALVCLRINECSTHKPMLPCYLPKTIPVKYVVVLLTFLCIGAVPQDFLINRCRRAQE